MIALLGLLLQTSAKASVAIAVVAVFQGLIGRRVSARGWYAIWSLVLIRLLIPVSLPSAWSVFNLVPAHPGIRLQLRGVSGQALFTTAAIELPWWAIRWKLLTAVWIAGALIVALRALAATLRMQRVVRHSMPVSGLAQQIVDEERRRLRIVRPVDVRESPLVDAPALHGLRNPVLLLPQHLPESFGAKELRHVIVHELSHVRRHDVAVGWMAIAIRALHWFNPLVWFAVARLQEERELACDELTLASFAADQHLDYGRTILKLLEQFRSPRPAPALVTIVNQKEKMKRRLIRIGDVRTMPRLATAAFSVLSAVVLFVLAADARDREPVARIRDSSSIETVARLRRPITLDLQNASAGELLSIVGRKCDVAVKAPKCMPHVRFAVHARNVPAETILAEALRPMRLVPVPDGSSVTIVRAPACVH